MSGLFLLLVSAFLTQSSPLPKSSHHLSSWLASPICNGQSKFQCFGLFLQGTPLDSKWIKIGTLSNLTFIDFSLTQIISTSVTILNIQITAKDYTLIISGEQGLSYWINTFTFSVLFVNITHLLACKYHISYIAIIMYKYWHLILVRRFKIRVIHQHLNNKNTLFLM